jgi:RHS repeat-associated protein
MSPARWLLLACASAATCLAGYLYDAPNLLSPYSSSSWHLNGVNSASTGMYTSSDPSGGSLIWGSTVPGISNSYEVKTTLTLGSSGGNYFIYLRGASNSMYGLSGTNYYAVAFANPTFSGGACSAGLYFLKNTISSGMSLLQYSTTSCHSGMVIRLVMNTSNAIALFVDNRFVTSYYDSSPITSGQPGVGVMAAPPGNGFTTIDIGHIDTIAPNPIDPHTVGTSSFPNHVEFQFPGATDDTNGIGVAYYQYTRNGSWLGFTSTPEFSDNTVAASTTYTYILQATDYHSNSTFTSMTVRTPPSGSIDPREVGVRSLGTYWGAGGEQIDMRSGNLNYTVPLVKAMARGGWSASFNLSYNSQNWRQDPGGTWELGRDVGYGYGWRLQAGSLTPVYQDYWNVHHYVFIDSTGAEYWLTQNSGGVWSSTEGIYIYYDSNSGRLYFKDGSFWTFGSLSAGGEVDAGTLYPTAMQDTNGNQISITYKSGSGLGGGNSSARIDQITDVRGVPFTFNYSGTHLAGITTTMVSPLNYSFTIATAQPLKDPFANSPYGTTALLQNLKQTGTGLTTSFIYDNAGAGGAAAGELTQITTPYGGHIRWGYGSFNYNGTRTLREVNAGRFLAMAAGATELQYSPWYSGNTTLTFHDYSGLDDADGVSEKAWNFQSDPAQPGYGLARYFEHRPHHWPTIAGEHSDSYIYATSSSGNTYLTGVYSTVDNGNPTALNAAITQTVDQYGNVTQKQVYGYNPTFPLPLMRTYNYTYLTGTSYFGGQSYSSLYIFNRLRTSTVTDASTGNTATMATVYYDGALPSPCPGGLSVSAPPPMTYHDSAYGTSYFARGMVSAVVTPSSTSCNTYDIGGNNTSSTSNGVTTTSAIDSSSYFTAPTTLTSGSLTNTMIWSPFLGINSASGANSGDTTNFSYDTNARPSTATSPLGAATTFAYNDTASPPTRSASVSGTGINTHWTRTTMDGFGRTIKAETGSGALTNTPVSVVDTVYIPCGCSPLGKVGQVSEPHTPGGTVHWTVYSYDGLGRTTRVLSPDGISQTLYAYSGNMVTVTDPAGKYKNMYMDKLGHLFSVQEPDPTYGLVSTNYTYDVLDHLTQVQMQRGSTTQYRTFNYTSAGVTGGDLLSAANPENGTLFYTYNATHTIATKVDAKNTHFAYTYDSFNRLLTVSAAGNTLRTYTYDANAIDPTYSHSVQGRLATIEYPAFNYDVVFGWPQGSTKFTDMFDYSAPGQVIRKRLRVTKIQPISGLATQTGSGDLNMTYAYNVEGKITNVTYPFDATTSTTPQYNYSYDTMMRPAGMTDLSSTLVSSVAYGPANEMLSMSYNGGTETRTYNSMLQLTQLVNTTPGQNLNITYTFPSGNAGKITSQTDNLSGETISYQYDSLNRLIQGSASTWSQTYSYDGFGNLTNRVGTGAALGTNPTPADPATNRLTGASYDANGNMLSFGNAYDVENRLSQANSGAAQYFYDGKNKRIWQGTFTNCSGDWCLTSDQVSMFGIDGKLIGTYTPSGGTSLTFASTAQRVYFAGKLIRQGFTGSQNVVQDRLGSVGKYYPYGEDRAGAPNDQVKFATYTRDTATGNDYADQRYYANTSGRFTSPDPYLASGVGARPQSWNRYAYVSGDPINYADPKGLDQCLVGWMYDANGQPVGDGGIYGACDGGGGGDGGDNSQMQTVNTGLATGDVGTAASIISALWAHSQQDLMLAAVEIANMTFSKECDDLIHTIMDEHSDGPTIAEIRSAALTTSFLPGDTSTAAVHFTLPSGGVVDTTVGSLMTNGVPGLIAPGTVYGYADGHGTIYWLTGAEDRGSTGPTGDGNMVLANVLHELLHQIGFSDTQIEMAFFGHVTDVTGVISDKLRDTCFH